MGHWYREHDMFSHVDHDADEAILCSPWRHDFDIIVVYRTSHDETDVSYSNSNDGKTLQTVLQHITLDLRRSRETKTR